MPDIQASFLCPFSHAFLGEGDTFLENFLGSFWGFVYRQPPPANPFSKPLKILRNNTYLSVSFISGCGFHQPSRLEAGETFVVT